MLFRSNFSQSLIEKTTKVRKSGLTFAAEAGTQRLRDVINKNVTWDEIEKTCSLAFANGYTSVKLYFMMGLPIACDALNARTVAVRSYHYVFCASSPANCHTCVTARYLSLGISSRIYVMAHQPPSSAQKERTRFAYDAPPFSCGHICQGASDRNEERGNTFLSGVSYLTRNVSSLVMSFVSNLRRSSSSTQRWGLPYSS